jgi:lysophospholipase L1-like esterase
MTKLRGAACCAVLLSLLQAPPAAAQEEDAPTIAVLGSSVAAGWVTSREGKHDLQNGWAARLGRLLEPRGFRVVNVSVPGDTTRSVLARMTEDLDRTDALFVLIALSLGNEGLVEDREAAQESFRDGLLQIVERCAEQGRIPLLGLCYPYDGYDEQDYAALLETNLWIQELGIACVNFLGALDDGTGRFVSGCTYDEGHPGNRGHEELFLSVVPSLFEAIYDGKTEPERPAAAQPTTVRASDGPAPLCHVPADPVHSFTTSFRFRCAGAGAIASLRVAQGLATLSLDEQGRCAYRSAEGGEIVTKAPLAKDGWHDLSLSHRHLLGRTELFVDGASAGFLEERLEPRQLVLGGSLDEAIGAPEEAEYRDWFIHRTALGPAEIGALREGAMLAASLEVYAPLDGLTLSSDGEVENLAQSTARVVSRPARAGEAIAQLEARLAEAAAQRAAEPLFPEPETVQVDAALLQEYAGKYEIGPGDVLGVRCEGERLLPRALRHHLLPAQRGRAARRLRARRERAGLPAGARDGGDEGAGATDRELIGRPRLSRREV